MPVVPVMFLFAFAFAFCACLRLLSLSSFLFLLSFCKEYHDRASQESKVLSILFKFAPPPSLFLAFFRECCNTLQSKIVT